MGIHAPNRPAKARPTPVQAGPRARFGQIRTRGNPYRWSADLYHRTMRARWRVLIPVAIVVYLIVNLTFASLYLVGDDNISGAQNGSFRDAFFFSVQTLSTIGYGGITPATTWANALVTVQAFLGIALTALSTGLAFAKFARPSAQVIFSQRAVVHRRNGLPCLTFRAANSRGTDIVEAQMHVSILSTEVTEEGHTMRRLRDLKLVRERSAVFLLSWQVMHEIDETSPLHQMTMDDLLDDNVMVVCTLHGIDGTTGQTTTSRQVYHAEDIDFGYTLVDVILPDDEGVILDFAKFHITEPEPGRDETPANDGVADAALDCEVASVDEVEGANDATPEEPVAE